LAVERGKHQLALSHVLGAVEQQHRVLAHDRLEWGSVRLAGVKRLRAAGEDLLDHLRVRDPDDLADHELDGEEVSVAPAAALEERDRPQHPLAHLDGSRGAWSRRKCHADNVLTARATSVNAIT